MATIQTLSTTENGLNSRTIINTNFSNLNTEVSTATSDINTLETTVNTGALAGTSGTPSGTNKFVTNDDTSETPSPNKVARYNSSGQLSGVPQSTDVTYPAGETLSAGNVVFIENAPTTAQATSAQNIGDVTANTRVSFPVFGIGVAGTTLALNLAKTGSPSVALGVRIETDNAGSPSGTLVNANATGTVAAASISTDAFGVDQTLESGKTSSGTGSATSAVGVRFLCNINNISFTSCSKNSSCIGSNLRGRLMDDSESITYATANFVGEVATFTPYALTRGVYYKVLIDNYGTSYQFTNLIGGAYPVVGVDANLISDNGNYKSLSFIVNAPTNTVTLAGSITIPSGQKCHVVTFQGTYGSESVNGSNFYRIGYSTNDSTTRFGKRWNGTTWTIAGDTVEETTGDVLASGASSSTPYGVKINVDVSLTINTVTKGASTSPTRCVIKNLAGTILHTATFSGNVATFSGAILAQGVYRVECDSNGASYGWWYDTTPANAQKTYIKYVTGSSYGVDDPSAFNITSINVTPIYACQFPYTTSTLFQPRVLSKTDADFTYKIDWHGITQEAVTAGNLTTGKYPAILFAGIDSNQSGLTQGTTMYLSNTAGAISSSAGTNSKIIGEAVDVTKLGIVSKSLIGASVTIATSASNTYASGNLIAPSNGMVCVQLNSNGASAGYTVTVVGATTLVTSTNDSYLRNQSITMPVRKGQIYTVTASAGANSTNTTTVYFVPIS